MRLLAIYNVWGDSLELLKGSIQSIRNSVDGIIIVAQQESNGGEIDRKVYPFCNNLIDEGLADRVLTFEPTGNNRYRNERDKRQIGIDFAKVHGYSHFLHMDSDEYYIESEFKAAKKLIDQRDIKGTYIDLYTYYKSPELRLSRKENYCVPFIHKVHINTKCGIQNRPFYSRSVDPTRAINIKSVFLKDIHMHHFSYLRKDLAKKLRNSTAAKNLKVNRILQEYKEAKEGYHLKAIFNDTLVKCPNQFNIQI